MAWRQLLERIYPVVLTGDADSYCPLSCFFCFPLPPPKYLLAEDLRLASVDAETILEAEELLGTMQDYLDSSVISIIEDFSSLTEVWNVLTTQSE